jgi:hypothetical protein
MRLVSIKIDDQLDLRSLHRVRERWVMRPTAVIGSGGRSDGYTQTDCNIGGGVNQPRAAYRTGFDPHPTQKERTCENDRQNTPHLRQTQF